MDIAPEAQVRPVLRAMAAGELLYRSVAFWRAHFLPLFQLMLASGVAMYALRKAGQYCSKHVASLEDIEALANHPAGLVAVAGVQLLVVIIEWWMLSLVLIAVTRYAVSELTGYPVGMRVALSRMVARAGTATRTMLVVMPWGVLVYALAMLPGALLTAWGLAEARARVNLSIPAWMDVTLSSARFLLLGASLLVVGEKGAVFWLVLRCLLISPILAEEDGSARDALRRNGVLMQGRVGGGFIGLVKVRASILLIGLGALVLVVTLGGGIPALLIHPAYGAFSAGPGAPPPLVPLVAAELFQVVAQSAVLALCMVLCAFFYVDLRIRKEGLEH